MLIRRRIHTQESAEKLTRAQLGKALARNHADSGIVGGECIAAGLGHMRPTEFRDMAAAGDVRSCVLQHVTLQDEYWALSLVAACRYLDRWY